MGLVSNATAKKPIILKAVTAWPGHQTTLVKFNEWIKQFNELAKGEVQINYIGGPEAIPYNEQAGALQRGVIDIACTAAAYHMGMIPEAEAIGISRLNYKEERERGFIDLLSQVYEKHDLKYLGRFQLGAPLGMICTNVLIKKPSELKGLKIRSVMIYDAFLKELGVIPVTVPWTEIYTSMERGLVDAFVGSMSGGFTSQGFHEVCKYVINHPFYNTPTLALMSLKTWNKLPEEYQDLLIQSVIDIEPEVDRFFRNSHEVELQKAKEAGVQIIEFSPEDAKWFLDTAYRVSWDNLLKKAPEYGPKLKEIAY